MAAPELCPIWFHWDGREFVLGTPPKAPKLKALAKNPKVALTIDDNNFPHKVLLVRGTAKLEPVNGVVPEYAQAANRYFGEQQGKAWVAQLSSMTQQMVRIAISPEWVGLLDFQTRFPSALGLWREMGRLGLAQFVRSAAVHADSLNAFDPDQLYADVVAAVLFSGQRN
jgi:hypothetical protein